MLEIYLQELFNEKECYTIKEVAQKISVSEHTVRRMVYDYDNPLISFHTRAFKGKILIPQAEIIRYFTNLDVHQI